MVSTWPTRSRKGAKTAYGAVAKPVEGTILTVIRESAAAAVTAAERDDDIEKVMAATVEAAEKSVALTPTCSTILREAGRRRFGRAGPLPAVRGRAAAPRRPRSGTAASRRAGPPHGAAKASDASSPTRTRASATRRCSSSIQRSRALDLDAIRDQLDEIGDSVLVAGDARASRSMSTTNGRIW